MAMAHILQYPFLFLDAQANIAFGLQVNRYYW